MTVHADPARRADFHIAWHDIAKDKSLAALTAELRKPNSALDDLIAPHIKTGPMPTEHSAAILADNPDLNRSRPSSSLSSRVQDGGGLPAAINACWARVNASPMMLNMSDHVWTAPGKVHRHPQGARWSSANGG